MAVVDTFAPAQAAQDEEFEVIASYAAYADAEHAVDRLADGRFPVEQVQILGRGLAFVEDVTGRRGHGRAAGEGALGGAFVAAFVGVLFGLLNWVDPLLSSVLLGLYGLAFGALFGAVLGLIAHTLTRGRRDFSSIRTMRADHYDVLAPARVAADARIWLA